METSNSINLIFKLLYIYIYIFISFKYLFVPDDQSSKNTRSKHNNSPLTTVLYEEEFQLISVFCF